MDFIKHEKDIADSGENLIKTGQSRVKKIVKISSFLFIFLIVGSFFFFNNVISSDQSRISLLSKIPLLSQIKHLAESASNNLKGEKEDRVNILLLGIGGRQHEGGYLTDTIILASLKPSTKKVSMLSIPRDLSVMVEGQGWRKINNINALAEAKEPGSGGEAISQAVSDILEIPIHYYIRVDFEGFVNIINEIGGIDVVVENAFDDYSYPVAGREDAEIYESRFEHLHFDKGLQKMYGDLALKYARSRHAYGIEGSDFARAGRQQNIIMAAKEKILSAGVLLNPKTVANIAGELNEHISTNLKIWEIIKLCDEFKDVKREDVASKVLDNGSNGLLVNQISSEGAYILAPKSGDFTEIRYLVNNIFSDAPVALKTKVSGEGATVEIRNGTWINGLASQAAVDLEKYGFNVVRVGNCSRQNFQKSVIYDLTYGEKDKSLSVLKDKTNANVSFGLPEWLMDDLKKENNGELNPIQPDFILVLGEGEDGTDDYGDQAE